MTRTVTGIIDLLVTQLTATGDRANSPTIIGRRKDGPRPSKFLD